MSRYARVTAGVMILAMTGWSSLTGASGTALTPLAVVEAAPRPALEGSDTSVATSRDYVALTPARLMDSRQPASPTIDGSFQAIGLRTAGSTTQLQITGRGGVPDTAAAVVLNITATAAQANGYVTVWPCGEPMPNASNLNFTTGQTIPNAVTTKIGTSGQICLYTETPTHLIADTNGYYPGGSPFVSLTPARLMDSRQPASPTIDGSFQAIGLRTAGSTTQLQITGRGGVPDTAAAVVLNITATAAQANGYVTVWPCGEPMPNASNLNFTTGQTIPNAVTTKIGTSGQICLYTETPTHLIADTNGYYPGGSPFVSLTPARLMDSRQPASPTIDGSFQAIGLRTAGSTTQLQITGRGGVPDTAAAVVLNITATAAQANGYVTVWPCGEPMPNASNLNFTTGQTIPNAVTTKIGTSGQICLYTETPTHLIADTNGYVPGPRYAVHLAMAPWQAGTDATAYRQQLAELKTRAGIANVVREYDSIPIVEVDVARPDQLASLHRNPYVSGIALEPVLASIDPSPTGVSTAGGPVQMPTVNSVALTGAAALHALGHTGVGTTVAVIDDFNPDPKLCYVQPPATPNCTPHLGDHAINVSGIVRAMAPGASILVYGFNWSTLPNGQYYGGIEDAINDIVQVRQVQGRNVVAVNMSFGDVVNRTNAAGETVQVSGNHTVAECADVTVGDGPFWKWVTDTLHAANVSAVAATGNSGFREGMALPGCAPGVIGVGATYAADYTNIRSTAAIELPVSEGATVATCYDDNAIARQPTCFSNASLDLDIWAPGAYITATPPSGGKSVTMSGTSQASPHVAAAVALLRSQFPSSSRSDVEAKLLSCSFISSGVQYPPVGLPYLRPFLSVDHPC